MASLSRRKFLQMGATVGATALLAACGAGTTTTTTSTSVTTEGGAGAATTAPATAATTAPATAATTAPTVAAEPTTAAAATTGPLPAAPAAGPLTAADMGGMEKLIEAARQEAELSAIALPDDWANYGEIKQGFLAKYSFLKHNDLSPDASSAQEVEAIKANAGNKGPQNPDVIDVGFNWGATLKSDNLVQPYKVETWDTIPESFKDADGYWVGDYYGTMCFEVNTAAVQNVPQDWADLLKPEYKGQIALAGDPTGAAQAIYAVWAAALGNGGTLDDPTPGLEFFKKLNDAGNLLPVIAKPATVAQGETPITLRWDYNALANRDQNQGIEIAVIVPASGTLAGPYLQAISAYAPRPHAARLWMEYLYSDEGQLLWLKGYAKPVRFDDLKARNVIPQDLLDKLPASTATISVPSGEQIDAAFEKIQTGWPTIVGATVQ